MGLALDSKEVIEVDVLRGLRLVLFELAKIRFLDFGLGKLTESFKVVFIIFIPEEIFTTGQKVDMVVRVLLGFGLGMLVLAEVVSRRLNRDASLSMHLLFTFCDAGIRLRVPMKIREVR